MGTGGGLDLALPAEAFDAQDRERVGPERFGLTRTPNPTEEFRMRKMGTRVMPEMKRIDRRVKGGKRK